MWQFENYLEAVDGSTQLLTQPPGSGSYYYNYKGLLGNTDFYDLFVTHLDVRLVFMEGEALFIVFLAVTLTFDVP